jgi:hypothetical protein
LRDVPGLKLSMGKHKCVRLSRSASQMVIRGQFRWSTPRLSFDSLRSDFDFVAS